MRAGLLPMRRQVLFQTGSGLPNRESGLPLDHRACPKGGTASVPHRTCGGLGGAEKARSIDRFGVFAVSRSIGRYVAVIGPQVPARRGQRVRPPLPFTGLDPRPDA